MAAEEIQYTLNGQLADNTVTVDNKDDKILVLVSNGSVDKQRVISEIMAINPGLERETVEAVINLEQRTVKRLVLTGHRVNMGLYSASAQFSGVINKSAWDPNRNSIFVQFTQGADMREAINATKVNIIGTKGATMYIAGGFDMATEKDGFVATAGRNFTITGAMLKVAGTDPSVGITLTDSKGVVTKITKDMFGANDPSKLTFLIPAGLADGEYELTVTSQHATGRLLKTPHSVSQTIYIGTPPEGGGGDTGGDDVLE